MEHKGFKIIIEPDDDAQSPDENGNTDLFLITGRNRYFEVTRDGFEIDDLRSHKADYHIIPLIAYIHSGVALSLGREYPFNDQWDSGQIGFVLVGKRRGFRNIRKAAENLVEEWNTYLSGDVWAYSITEEGEHVDSCCGFYGHEYCTQSAIEAAEHCVSERAKLEAMERNCFAL